MRRLGAPLKKICNLDQLKELEGEKFFGRNWYIRWNQIFYALKAKDRTSWQKLPTYTLNIFSLFCGHYLIFQNYRQTLTCVLFIKWKYVIFFVFLGKFQLLLRKWCLYFEPFLYQKISVFWREEVKSLYAVCGWKS